MYLSHLISYIVLAQKRKEGFSLGFPHDHDLGFIHEEDSHILLGLTIYAWRMILEDILISTSLLYGSSLFFVLLNIREVLLGFLPHEGFPRYFWSLVLIFVHLYLAYVISICDCGMIKKIIRP